MKISCEKACDFFKALVCSFGKIDADIHHVLAKNFNFLEFEFGIGFTEGYQEMSLGATNLLELRVVYKKANDDLKYFIHVTAMHRLTRRIHWLGEVRKFC